MTTATRLLVPALALGLLGACASSPGNRPMSATPFSQQALPAPVQVPTGHAVAMETVGKGEITYECRAKADAAGAFEWFFVGPQADLLDRAGTKRGTYFGPPATWAASDGSRITGAQVAVAPLGAGNLPAQLVKANPASGPGAMNGISYIQRVATQGGVAPSMACGAASVGTKQIVRYQADYIFWKPV